MEKRKIKLTENDKVYSRKYYENQDMKTQVSAHMRKIKQEKNNKNKAS